MRYLITLFFSLFASAFVGLAQTDVIKEELAIVRAVHLRETETAKNNLIDAMEMVHKKFAQRGELENVKAVQSQKELFERDGTLPTSPRLASARSEYEKELRLANNSLRKGLERAKVDYTKVLKIPEADAVAAELTQMDSPRPRPNSVPTVRPAPVAEDLFPVGSFWSGQVITRSDGRESPNAATLLILERSPGTFRAREEILAGPNHQLREITGTVEGNKIRWLAQNAKVSIGRSGWDCSVYSQVQNWS